ncbi:MAG: hypothetical protein CEO22_309 [Candidatus Berkelbacteria bacterium Gr01-1014_85]|uniref:Nudix hydrolase domain-containing protein n=1 Tax=Candidatus Berkelbacteria bacterium Gr01-1014_85 TaxID=2017150 RepID=A0A554JC92_9BACT|nr:MAG: hypothetical protein CEO22_309 [Candidatus Berkelbacteria bacterium Gr01-1014_85]
MNEDLKIMVEAIVYHVNDETPAFLLLKRSDDDGGFWQPVTGSVEPNETVLQALKREVYEETGIDELKSITDEIFQFTWQKDDQIRQEKVYGVLVDQGTIKLSHEHSTYRWYQFNEAIELLRHEDNREAFRNLMRTLESKNIGAGLQQELV